MPIYEYVCENCGEFEVTQRITAKDLARCPNCEQRVKKLISNTSFQLKGTGWYLTDYARKGKGADGEGKGADGEGKGADGKGASKSTAADTGKAEGKSAASPADKTSTDKKSPSQKSSESSAS